MTVITRFAPSPTGFLHIGGARTSLYSYLYARHNKGQFILRVEDTDFERNSEEATQGIIEAMEWLGMNYDQGPFFQSKRMERYREVIAQMLKDGTAYRCYCTKEQLQADRDEQEAKKLKPKYVGRCRDCNHQDETKPHVIRFKNPLTGNVSFCDEIRGDITFANEELDDFIIARTDGTPTYNFCVVVDDMDMGITHVVRGEDHINNTPRQINVLNALGAKVPTYAHVSMINGSDGKKLSKRHGAVNVMQFKDDGYLPQAINNYIVRLGWGHGDQEIFTAEEMTQLFNINNVSKNPSTFDYAKLNWLNQHYMRDLSASDLAKETLSFVDYQINGKEEVFSQVLQLYVERCHTLKELASEVRFFFEDFSEFEEAAAKKHLVDSNVLTLLRDDLQSLSTFDSASVHDIMVAVASKVGVGMGKVGMPLRVSVTGKGQSPSIDQICSILGRDVVVKRLNNAINYIKQKG